MGSVKDNGGARKGAGRPSKAKEQHLIENLTPFHKDALKALKKAITSEEPWAIKLYMEFFYGKPRQQLDVTTDGEPINTPTINFTKH